MDAFLDFLGLYRSEIAKDGSCLFRTVSEQLFFTQVHHVKLREHCVEYIARNRRLFEPYVNQDFDEYLEKIKSPTEWVGEVEINALALKYKIDFLIYTDVNKSPLKIKVPSSRKTIVLACTGVNSYYCVYLKSDLSALAFCQAVVYEVLYKRVFELGADVDIAVEKMLHDKTYSKQRRSHLLSHLFRESCRIEEVSDHHLHDEDEASLKNPKFEIRKALAQGIPPFPYKVAKTLDPGIYRNVEFDVWNEKRKDEQKNEQFIIPKLEPGVKCKVYINKEKYTGHVQDIDEDADHVSVYVEELCTRCRVSTSVLEIMAVPAYKALTWQGGKTYKVCSENVPIGSKEGEKVKKNKGCKKNYQEYSPVHSENNSSLKGSIVRCNSLPASSQQNNSKNPSTPQLRRKGPSSSTPISNKNKSHSPKESRHAPVRPSSNYPSIWNAIDKNLPTSPIPIPRKLGSDCYSIHPESPEAFNELNGRNWTEETLRAASPPYPYAFTPVYADDTGYASMGGTSFNGSATSVPLPIPGAPVASPSEDASPPLQPAMTVYPYPVYAMPGMYLVCRDGSTLPVNLGPWSSQDATEVPAGIPSVYFNSPPTGMSPPVAPWISNYGSTWTQGMPGTVAFTPPLEINTLVSPPWSPPSGIYLPPPSSVAYHQVPPSQPHLLVQEPAQN